MSLSYWLLKLPCCVIRITCPGYGGFGLHTSPTLAIFVWNGCTSLSCCCLTFSCSWFSDASKNLLLWCCPLHLCIIFNYQNWHVIYSVDHLPVYDMFFYQRSCFPHCKQCNSPVLFVISFLFFIYCVFV